MSNFLTAAKSVRSQEGKENDADTLLTAVKSTKTRSKSSEAKGRTHPETEEVKRKPKSIATSPEDILQILRSQPDLDTLIATLNQLRSQAFRPGFDIHSPGPLQAQIINTLLTTIVPDTWHALREQDAQTLTACLLNVAGLNALVARLRLLSSQNQGPSVPSQQIDDLLDLADRLFKGDDVLCQVRENIYASNIDPVRLDMAWKELVNLVSSGKIVSTIAQAEDISRKDQDKKRSESPLAKGGEYAAWLGRNIATLIDGSTESPLPSSVQLLAKGLNLGYPIQLLEAVFKELTVTRNPQNNLIQELARQVPTSSRRVFVEHLLRWLSTISGADADFSITDVQCSTKDIPAVASFISIVVSADQSLRHNIESFLVDPTLLSLLSLPCRRACLVAISTTSPDSDGITSLLEKLMSSFNDQLFISHAPVLQQESLAQTLLLTAGYLHRMTPMALLVTARSSNHMSGVSNRLDSSNVKGRWLGMVVGTAISSLVDKEGSRMSFGTDDMETEEANRYVDLVKTQDNVGRLEEFGALLKSQDRQVKRRRRPAEGEKPAKLPIINGKPVFGPPRPPPQTEVVGDKVKEILDGDSDEEDDELKPYAKPDSDPEDSDEDATLVDRNKAKPPVYIRGLMSMLRDDQNADKFQLGLKHAASLIRRKMSFGAEVKDHAEEIGVILCNLQDPFDTENFEELRLQAMIAVLLSDLKIMAPWLCKQAFLGDYSIAQRCVILSALGLGGRELAGLKNEDELNPSLSNTTFPSKKLPPHLHSIYSAPTPSTKRLEAASQNMEQTLIKPLALQAADQSTAHLNAVKVNTFSSRMEVERTKRKPAPNELAKIFGSAFFYPLVNRYQQEVAAYGSASVFTSVPFVLVTFLKTVALLFHASGPATLNLSEISGEFWDLLLSLRVQAIGDITILHAVLFSLLTLLELNTDKRRIVDEHPRRLMETQQWVDLVFERTGGGQIIDEGGNEQETKVRTLAAGVLVKAKEVIEAYQKELVGYTFG